MSKKIRVSEIFSSMQGEGKFIGKPSLWIRLFGCNLSCDGFGQKDPTNPKTYILPYKDIDTSKYKSMQDLPVFSYGCDSSYSWYNKFKHLAPFMSPKEIVSKLCELGIDELGIDIDNGSWIHPKTKADAQLCFTGGEPMLQQDSMAEIVKELVVMRALPGMITIETNATQKVDKNWDYVFNCPSHIHLSCSPKLFHTSGEANAINITIIKEYMHYADSGILKFVVNGNQETWDELDKVIDSLSERLSNLNKTWSIYVMPVNSTTDTLTPEHTGAIAREAMKRGYLVSPRAHVHLFGNQLGT